jgi:Kef-type K+ transport system membrane component KefB
VSTAALLSLLLSKMRQPKVIAEVLGGILLGAFILFMPLSFFR